MPKLPPPPDHATCYYCDNEFHTNEMFIANEEDLWFCEGCFQLVNPKVKI
jgi:NAD-dependent SIR2 family protein deacetylase